MQKEVKKEFKHFTTKMQLNTKEDSNAENERQRKIQDNDKTVHKTGRGYFQNKYIQQRAYFHNISYKSIRTRQKIHVFKKTAQSLNRHFPTENILVPGKYKKRCQVSSS